MFRSYIFSSLMKWLRGPGEMASRAAVWRPLC